MRNLMLCAGLAAMVATQAVATPPTVIITVSCWRGPWKEVVWDRANPVFVDSLMAAGYSLATAQAISTRACRDPNLVGNPDAMLDEVWRLLKNVPRDGRPVTP